MNLISIIIPSYNRYESLQETILSAKMQKGVYVEIIVIDDCSTDIRYKDLESIYPDVIFIHLPVNLREKFKFNTCQGYVRNEGIKVAKGEWLAFLDDDDKYICEDKLYLQLKLMEKYNCLMSSTNMLVNSKYPYFPTPLLKGEILEKNIIRICLDDIREINYINNSTVLVNRSIIDEIGGFRLVENEDYDLWLRVLECCDCIYLTEPMVDYSLDSIKYYK